MIISLILAYGCQSKTEENTPFYVGTYTFKESKGIYKYQLSSEGKIAKIGLVAEIANPTFLTKTIDNNLLFAVSEVDENGTGFVKSYKILKDSLVMVSTQKTGGAGPCFVAVNGANYVITANYGGGNVGLLQTDSSGKLSSLLNVQQHFGKGTTDRQTAPHAHSAWFHPTKNEVISVDLGTNQLWFSTINKKTNELDFNNPKTLNMAAGAGPRHITFHSNSKWIYVLNELNNTVSLLKENKNGYFIEATVPTLPTDFKEYSKGADIHISKDGKFLYASNRGHESIVIYKVNPTNGHLEIVGYQPTYGKTPRNFSLSPDERFLLVANQDTNNIVCFKRDITTGKLTYASEISAPNPVCLLF